MTAGAMGGRRALFGFVGALVLLLVFPISGAWASREPHLTASFIAVGSEVDVTGVVGAGSAGGVGSRSRWKALLQQRVGRHWLTRASGGLHSHSGFSLAWTGSTPGRRETMRVEIVAGHRVIVASAGHSVVSRSLVSVQSTLRRSTVQPSARQIVSVSGASGGSTVVVLGKGARVPAVGGALVVDPSATAPNGLLGVVTAVSRHPDGTVSVATRPGTLDDAYSSFDAHLNGGLGQLVAGATTASLRAHAAVNLGVLDASFSCDDTAVQSSITHNIDLSAMHVSADVAIPSPSNGYYGPGVEFALYGQPKLDFGVTFTGAQSCKAQALVKIPIPDTPGLFVEIGPDFTLSASGSVGIGFTWEPKIFYGFARFRSGPNWDSHVFHNGGKVSFTGAAGLTLSLALDVGISLDGRVGVRGSLGPEVTGQVSTQTSPPQSCLSVDADFGASLTAFANVFFGEYDFNIGSVKFGDFQLYRNCASSGAGAGSGAGGTGGGGGTSGGGQVTGRATGIGGSGIPGVYVGVLQASGEHTLVGYAQTDNAGYYTISNLPAGEFKVGFLPGPEGGYAFRSRGGGIHITSPTGAESGYAFQYYNGGTTLAAAETVKLQAGAAVENVDAELAASGRITGTVTGEGGHTIEGAEVCAYEFGAGIGYGLCARTDKEGRYAISGLAAGSYAVEFAGPEGSSYTTQFWNGKPKSEANEVKIEAGHTHEGINATMTV